MKAVTSVRQASTKSAKKDKDVSPLGYVPTGSANLYENNNTKPNFFGVVSAISGIQLLFWIYLAYFAFTELKEVDSLEKEKTENDNKTKQTRGIDDGSFVSIRDGDSTVHGNPHIVNNKYDSFKENDVVEQEKKQSLAASVLSSYKLRILVSLLSLSAGVFFAVSACMYPLRVVHKLIYIRPTQAVQLVTYTPLGMTRTLTVPLQDVTCSGSRFDGPKKGHFGLKIKGHSLYFLLDQQAMDASPNVRMFDQIIGTRQKLY